MGLWNHPDRLPSDDIIDLLVADAEGLVLLSEDLVPLLGCGGSALHLGLEKNITDMVFTIASNDLPEAKKVVESVADKLNAVSVIIEEDVAKVSIVGAGMLGAPGIAARMFGALAKASVNIDIISTSEISVSCLIKGSQVKDAVNSIHEEFFPN